jgi:hypothetical protein
VVIRDSHRYCLPCWGRYTGVCIPLGIFSHFPTPTEQTIWRVAACSVAVGDLIIVAALGVLVPTLRDDSWWVKFIDKWRSSSAWRECLFILAKIVFVVLLIIFVALSASVLVLATAAFCGTRVFLVVEAFISIRSLPEGAYETVNYLPHLGG